MINPYCTGKTVYLRAPTQADAEGAWYQWFSDPETTSFLVDRFWPNTAAEQMNFVKSLESARDRLVLSVCLRNDQHIGVCSLSAINWVHRFADIAIVIGEKAHRIGPAAVETMALLLETAFLRLNLLNIKSVHMSSNPVTPLLEKTFGFVPCGRYEKIAFHQGKQVDLVMTKLSSEDWLARNQGKLSK